MACSERARGRGRDVSRPARRRRRGVTRSDSRETRRGSHSVEEGEDGELDRCKARLGAISAYGWAGEEQPWASLSKQVVSTLVTEKELGFELRGAVSSGGGLPALLFNAYTIDEALMIRPPQTRDRSGK